MPALAAGESEEGQEETQGNMASFQKRNLRLPLHQDLTGPNWRTERERQKERKRERVCKKERKN